MSTATLKRTAFSTSRVMDFFSQKELTTQTGHDPSEWPFVILKETIDNALDATENADVAPVITIVADETSIAIFDNGPGLPESTLTSAMDFTVRASDKEAYISPCRGAQGNALKTLLPMPFVIDPDHGRLVIEAHDKRHVIYCAADPISQRPVIRDETEDTPTTGTMVKLRWDARSDDTADTYDESIVWPFDGICPRLSTFERRFKAMVTGFALFNPHATFVLRWFGDETRWDATVTSWDKWKPNKPTSAHWYEHQHLARLVGAYITHDRDRGVDRLVSDFVAEFDGMSGSAKRSTVLKETGLLRVPLSAFANGDRMDDEKIRLLLESLKRNTRPVTPKRIGIIGEDHLRHRLLQIGIKPETFRYSQRTGPAKSKNGDSGDNDKACSIPWVLESAFGYLGDDSYRRNIFAGANWSAAIRNPFRSFGATGEGLEAALTKMHVSGQEPVVFVLHLAHPRVEYTDRGKSALVIGGAA